MKLSDVDLAFIASNAYGNKKFPYRSDFIINPERQIIRYQLLEVMIRLALERFSLRQKMSALDAVKLFYEQYIEEPLSKYDSHSWRLDRFWN